MISLLAALAFAATPSPATNIPSPPAQLKSLRELKLAVGLSATGEAPAAMVFADAKGVFIN